MKKLIFSFCGAAIVAAALMFNLQANQTAADSVSLMESVQIEAIAGSYECYQAMGYCGWFSGLDWICEPEGYDPQGPCQQYYCEDCDNI